MELVSTAADMTLGESSDWYSFLRQEQAHHNPYGMRPIVPQLSRYSPTGRCVYYSPGALRILKPWGSVYIKALGLCAHASPEAPRIFKPWGSVYIEALGFCVHQSPGAICLL